MKKTAAQLQTTVTKRFNKENGIWYIDLPEYLEAGLGFKGNLMMVAGADTMLDILSDHTETVQVKFGSQPFEGCTHTLLGTGKGMNKEVLDAVGHPEVEYGGYYYCPELGFTIWLCPVTEYVFQGGYPDNIYVQVIK